MSEQAPTTLTLDDHYKNGRPGRGRATVGTEVPLTPLVNPENETHPELNAEEFFSTMTELRESLQANPNNRFDADGWLQNPAEGSDDAVYAKVLERLADKNVSEPLLQHEVRVLRHAHHQTVLNQMAARIDTTIATNRDAFISKAQEALNGANQNYERAPDAQKAEKRRRVVAIGNTLTDIQTNAKGYDGDKSPLVLYFEAAEALESHPDDAHVATLGQADKALTKQEVRMNNHVFTYKLIGDKYPANPTPNAQPTPANPTTPEQQLQSAQESERLISLREQQAAKTSLLAEQIAKRQKHVYGLDKWNVQYKALEQGRRQLNQQLIAEEIRGRQFATEDELNLYIANRTVDLCKELDEEVRQNYMKNDGLVGKAINFLTGRNPDGTPDKSKKKMAARLLIQAGIGAGLLAATVATGGAAGLVAASSAVTGARIYALGQKIVRNKRVKRTGGLLTQEEVLARIKAVSKTGSTWATNENGELLRDDDGAAVMVDYNGGEHYLEALLKESTKIEQKAIDKDTRNWKLGNLATVAAGVAAGTFAGTVLHGAFGDHASAAPGGHEALAADPSSHVLSQPLSPDALHNLYTGPSSINVHPGDGFFKVFEQMNIPQDQWNSVLSRVGDHLVQHGDAYWMPDGTAGISAPGQMSQFAFDAIKQAANLR